MPVISGLYYTEHISEDSIHHPAVLFLHGAGSSSQIWPSEMRRLRGFRTLALDLPGHGKSAGIGAQTITAYAESVLEFLNALQIYQVLVVGHSMGGAIALSLAANAPELVSGLGLISTGAAMNVPEELLESLSSSVTFPLAVQLIQNRLFSPRSTPAFIEQCLTQFKSVRQSVLYADFQACADFDMREQMTEMDIPAWIACGVDDRMTPVSGSHFLSTRLPQATLQLVPAAGHMLPLEQPRQALEGLTNFLANLRRTREQYLWRAEPADALER